MKAQMVKNAVIVPVGSKGGFVVKNPPPAATGRAALMAEVVECYRTLMRGMLDLTDTIGADGVLAPTRTVRRDGDDPYLVVAADKGTATFSDIANGIARDYGFWLDDAFASGGSAGYDHKAMGITARGAWEAVKRHFRELGQDIQTSDFTVTGIGDMAGDVFGNGMLLSRHIRLRAAFNHQHIFLDPEPDAAGSWTERKRLFDTTGTSWADYDRSLLSPGGAVFERTAKSVALTPEAQTLLGTTRERLPPADLIRLILQMSTDLLWLGGIGTYVKSSDENQLAAGDKANDMLRVDGRDLRAKVVGEGANLGFTQRGRIEYALQGNQGAGGRINTDAIDNSAGVDTSDHEVNIKILTRSAISAGRLDNSARDPLLAGLTEEVAAHVLRHNYLQTQALTQAEAEGVDTLEPAARLMRQLEQAGRLDRALEFLPDADTLTRRQAEGRGLTRPELSVLLAYAKNAAFDAVVASPLPDDPALRPMLDGYFPKALAERFPEDIGAHRLRREILATTLANTVVNRMGPFFLSELELAGTPAAEGIAAFELARRLIDADSLWDAIEALDATAPAARQTLLLTDVSRTLANMVEWLCRPGRLPGIESGLTRYGPFVRSALEAGTATDLADELPAGQAVRLGALATAVPALEMAEIGGADQTRQSDEALRNAYFGLASGLAIDRLRATGRALLSGDAWDREGAHEIDADLASFLARAVRETLASGKVPETWLAEHPALVRAAAAAREQVETHPPSLALLLVESRRLAAALPPSAGL